MSTETRSRYLDTKHDVVRKPWSPINDKYYEDDSSDKDDDEDNIEEDTIKITHLL